MKNTTLVVVFITSWFMVQCNNVAEHGADAFVPGSRAADKDAFVTWGAVRANAVAVPGSIDAPVDVASFASYATAAPDAADSTAEATEDAGEEIEIAEVGAADGAEWLSDADDGSPLPADEPGATDDVATVTGPPPDPCAALGCPTDTACMKWECNLIAQKCKAFVPIGKACDDNDPCTAGDVCTPIATCVGTLPSETCGDAVDNDCDGITDETCAFTLLIEPMILMMEPVEDEAMCGAELYYLPCDPPACVLAGVATPQDVLATKPTPYQAFDPAYPLPQLAAFTVTAPLPLYLDVRYEEGRVDHQCFNVFYTFSDNSWNKAFRVTIEESGIVLWATAVPAANGAVLWVVSPP